MDEDTRRPRRSRVMTAVLIVSLSLNLVVAGIVIGAVLRGGPSDGAGRLGRDVAAPFTRALERSERRAVGRQMRQALSDAGGARAVRREMRTTLQEALAILRADTFDAAALTGVLERRGEIAQTLGEAGRVALVAQVSSMSLAERRAYADRVELQIRARGSKRGADG